MSMSPERGTWAPALGAGPAVLWSPEQVTRPRGKMSPRASGPFMLWSEVVSWLAAPVSPLWYPGPLTWAACALTSTLPIPTEAAFTLLLYCELLQWEERPLREFLHYPSQTEWQRKEGLCRKIIHYFSKGKVGQRVASWPGFHCDLWAVAARRRVVRVGSGEMPRCAPLCRWRGFLLVGG